MSSAPWASPLASPATRKEGQRHRRGRGFSRRGVRLERNRSRPMRYFLEFCSVICCVIFIAISSARAPCAPPTRGAARLITQSTKAASSSFSGSSFSTLMFSFTICCVDLAVDDAALVEVIEGEVGVRLGRRGSCASFSKLMRLVVRFATQPFSKRMPSVGDVLRPCSGPACRRNRRLTMRRAHQVQHDFDVMNHEVEHHADVGAATGISGEPVRLDEARAGKFFLRCALRAGLKRSMWPTWRTRDFFAGPIPRARRACSSAVGGSASRRAGAGRVQRKACPRARGACWSAWRWWLRRTDVGERLRGGEGLHSVPLRDLLRNLRRRDRTRPTNWTSGRRE